MIHFYSVWHKRFEFENKGRKIICGNFRHFDCPFVNLAVKMNFFCNLLFSFSWVQVVFYVYLLFFVANLQFLVLYIKRISIFVFLPFFVFRFSFCVFLYFISLFSLFFFPFSFFIPFSFVSFLYFNCFLFSFSVNFIFLFSLFVILFSVFVILFCCFPFPFFVILSILVQLLKSGFVSASGMAIFPNTPFAKTHSTKMCL